ncbi:MAG: tRNA (adenosine(37)-N6)-threonylcarbamoyltransferase complex ATPase subunit type 1 TsaE [Bacteroidaceae bacterium]|nr:tRNA (adenosine(37)-N6)-threonylcarbamoyltransferase complex ATPase subunit type 1 TsaE [Bacteroidaceae bacterium]
MPATGRELLCWDNNVVHNSVIVQPQTINIPTLDHITQAARTFVDNIGNRRLFAFYGSMGAGKTTFIRAICQQLHVTDDVTSPTFAIVNEYRSGILPQHLATLASQPVYHFDFYRIRRPEEIFDIGFEEYIDSGNLCLMEWPELVEQYLPEDTVTVKITEQPDGARLIEIG